MNISFDLKFWQSVHKLARSEQPHVVAAVNKYQRSPDHPSLRLHKLNARAGKKRLSTISAGSGIRILLARQGNSTVFLRAGQHDPLYSAAERMTYVAPMTGAPRLISITSDGDEPRSPTRTAARPVHVVRESPHCLQHWTDSELKNVGFNDDEVATLRGSTLDDLAEAWPDIPNDKLDLVFKCEEHTPHEVHQGLIFADDNAENERFRTAIVERGALAGLSSLLAPDEFKRLMAAPVEDWMIFLHPAQHAIVNRRFAGPARVRGAAGTGKTSVALHRAAILAKRYRDHSAPQRPVLFTTYIRSLPPVLSRLYNRLPNSVHGVEFVNIDKLANRICRTFRQPPRLDSSIVNSTFERAIDSVVRANTPLHGFTPTYLREEVTAVLKGRGVDSLDDYLALDRTGRKTRFTSAMREQAWALRMEWDKNLRERGIEDFADVVRRARDLARQHKPMYRAAIIDESQDLSLTALQLVYALVGDNNGEDQTDVLFMVGDGAQKIYPGGFTLTQAGLDVRGNSAVLRTNYRNTHEILSAAMACAGSDRVDDLGDEYQRGEADVETQRPGIKPKLLQVGAVDDQLEFIGKQIGQMRENNKIGLGDIGILAHTNNMVKRAIYVLQEKEGIACQNLYDFDGRPRDAVKVGTVHRAKGLEFKVLFLLDVSHGIFPHRRKPGQSEAEYAEYLALAKGQLFVAMTRARDALFVLHRGRPSVVLAEALDHFDTTSPCPEPGATPGTPR